MDICTAFNQFAGREIDMKKNVTNIAGHTLVEWEPAENEPTLKEMHDLAKSKDITLRVWFPGMAGTMDMRPDRVNAYIVKDDDNAWKIANNFTIG